MSLIRLEAQPVSWPMLVGPAAAAVAGGLSSGAALSADNGLRLLLVVLLVEAGWGSLWAAVCRTDWVRLRLLWVNRDAATDPVAWLRETFWPAAGRPLMTVATLGLFSLALAAALGPAHVLLTVGATAAMQLAFQLSSGRGRSEPLLTSALLGLGLPFLAGAFAFGSPSAVTAGLAAAFSLAYAGLAGAEAGRAAAAGWVLIGLIVAIPAVVAGGGAVGAAAIGMLLAPVILLLPWLRAGLRAPDYARIVQWPLLLSLLIAAWAVRGG